MRVLAVTLATLLLLAANTARSADTKPFPSITEADSSRCFSMEAIKLGFIERGMLPTITGFINGHMMTIWADEGGAVFTVIMVDAKGERGCFGDFGSDLRYHSHRPPASG